MDRSQDRESMRLAGDSRQGFRKLHARNRCGSWPERAANFFRRKWLGVKRVALVRSADLKEDDASWGAAAVRNACHSSRRSGSLGQNVEQTGSEQAGRPNL
jgi:hypothetical protein